jgi:peptidoglycan lytic transglycosylase
MDVDRCAGRCGRIAHRMAVGATCLMLAACANGNMTHNELASRADPGDVASTPPAQSPKTASHVASKHKTAHRHVARAHAGLHKGLGYSAVGLASWYGAGFHGRRTADGETFDKDSLTAAHPSLPLPCEVRVTNLANRRSLVVRVNDRGPYVGRRLIDVSARTAKLLGFYDRGLAKVKVEYVGRAPLRGADKPTND